MKDSNNKHVCHCETIKNGYVNEEFMKKNNATENSHPADWFKLFLPNRVDKVTKCGTDAWNTYTNLKGLLSNIGHEGRTYSKFKPFTPNEMMAFIGLLMLNGLQPSMRFEHKFKSQIEDPVAGNDLCARIFGENGSRRWKEFKHCFSLVDPRATAPSKKVSPNYKVQPFLDHMHIVNHEAWVPGKYKFICCMFY